MENRVSQRNETFFDRNKVFILCHGIVIALLGVISIILLFNRSFTIFPANNLENRIFANNDNLWNGKSRIEEFGFDKKAIVLKYILKEGAPLPLVFFTLNLGRYEKPMDLSRYDSVSLQIREATPKRVIIYIKTFVPGISSFEPVNSQTLRHNQYILQLSPGCHRYTIKLNDFETPYWWLETVGVQSELLPEELFSKTIAFDIQFNKYGSDYKINRPEKIRIENISFNRALAPLDVLVFVIDLLYFLWLCGDLIRRKLKKRADRFPRPKALEASSFRENEMIQIKEYIENHYCEPNVSTRMVAETLGMSSSRVFELVRDEYHLTFKQLINNLRIEEAKRLLKETDLKITEIAFNLGFNSVSYFNNLFKNCEGKTPSEYRDREMQS